MNIRGDTWAKWIDLFALIQISAGREAIVEVILTTCWLLSVYCCQGIMGVTFLTAAVADVWDRLLLP